MSLDKSVGVAERLTDLAHGDQLGVFPDAEVVPSELQICANPKYYLDRVRPYPRSSLVRALRAFIAARIPTWIAFLGAMVSLIWSLFQNSIKQYVAQVFEQGLRPPDWTAFRDAVQTSATWKWAQTHPIVAVSIITAAVVVVVCFLLAGAWARADRKRERDVLKTLETQLKLASAFRAYLTDTQASVGALPPLLLALFDEGTAPGSDENIATVFAPLQLHAAPLPDLHGASLDSAQRAQQERDTRKKTPDPALPPVDDITEAFKHAPNGVVALLGQPGAGKTTLLQSLLWRNAQALLTAKEPINIRIPVYIDLASQKSRLNNIPTIIESRVRSACAGVEASTAIAAYLTGFITSGRAIVVVDGLDEVTAGVRTDAISHITGFMNARHRPSSEPKEGQGDNWDILIVVGSRLAGYNRDSAVQGAETWELLPLTDRNAQLAIVSHTVNLWQQAHKLEREDQSTTAPEILLDTLSDVPLRGWAESPLLLTLSAIVWAENGGTLITHSRVALYYSTVHALIGLKAHDWPEQDRDRILRLAEEVALSLFLRGNRAFSVGDFDERVAPTLPITLPQGKEYGPDRLAPADALARSSGLFFRVVGGEYNVLHQTILEYLVASALARRLCSEWTSQVDSSAFTRFLTEARMIGEFHTPAEEARSRARTLGLLWAKRTPSRWIEPLRQLTGLLAESPTTNQSPASLNRVDLALAWVHALLSQPTDPGGFGVALALLSIAEIPLSSADSLVKDVVERALAGQLNRSTQISQAFGMLLSAPYSRIIVDNIISFLNNSPDDKMQQAAIRALGNMGEYLPTEALDALAAALANPVLHQEALWVLDTYGNRVSPATGDILAAIIVNRRTDPDFRTDASYAFDVLTQHGAHLSPESIIMLLKVIVDRRRHFDVRDNALRALGSLGATMPPAAVTTLTASVADPHADVFARSAAATLLVYMGTGIPRESISTLASVALEPHTDTELRDHVVRVLGWLGDSGTAMPHEGVQALIAVAADEDAEIELRRDAANSLSRLAPSMSLDGAIPLLEAMADARAGSFVRSVAAQALGKLGPSIAPNRLDAFLAVVTDRQDDRQVRYYATAALGELGASASPNAIAMLTSIVAKSEEDVDIRTAAVFALRRLIELEVAVPQEAINSIVAIAADRDTDETLRLAAVNTLGTLGSSALNIRLRNRTSSGELLETIGELGISLSSHQTNVLLNAINESSDHTHAHQRLIENVGVLAYCMAPEGLALLFDFVTTPHIDVLVRRNILERWHGANLEMIISPARVKALLTIVTDPDADPLREFAPTELGELLRTGLHVSPEIGSSLVSVVTAQQAALGYRIKTAETLIAVKPSLGAEEVAALVNMFAGSREHPDYFSQTDNAGIMVMRLTANLTPDAITSLGTMSQASVACLVSRATDAQENALVRTGIIQLLLLLDARALASVAPKLLAIARDTSTHVSRRLAVQILSQLRSTMRPEIIDTLTMIAQDLETDAALRVEAELALGSLGPQMPLEAMRALLRDARDPDVYALLGGPHAARRWDRDALQTLQSASQSNMPTLRDFAQEVLVAWSEQSNGVAMLTTRGLELLLETLLVRDPDAASDSFSNAAQ